MIETTGLTLAAGQRLLLDQLSWRAREGENWCVIGPNGAGKSTFLRALAGVRAPDGGAIAIKRCGLGAWPLVELARVRAWLPQSRGDAFAYSVIDTVLAARHPYQGGRHWEGSEDLEAAKHALSLLDVLDLAGRDVRTLSGGERQRVALAAVLAQDTPMLLLDEPANALDLAHQVAVTGLLARLCRDHGKLVVQVVHDLNQASAGCTHVLLLMPGGAWHAGPVGEVMQPELLTKCLGHPVAAIAHAGRTIYIPEARKP
jgi:iron complex transport system ATP-binding protein